MQISTLIIMMIATLSLLANGAAILAERPATSILAVQSRGGVQVGQIDAKQVGGDVRFDASRMAFSPDGRIIACSSIYDVHLFETATLKHIGTLKGRGGNRLNAINAIAFAPKGDSLHVAEGTSLRQWRLSDQKVLNSVDANANVTSIAFPPDGTLASTADDTGIVSVWANDFSKKLRSLRVDRTLAVAAPFSPNGKLVYAMGVDSIYVWEHENGRTLAVKTSPESELVGLKPTIVSIDVSAGGEFVVLADSHHGITIADSKSLKTISHFQAGEIPRPGQQRQQGSSRVKILGTTKQLVYSGGNHFASVYTIADAYQLTLATVLVPPSKTWDYQGDLEVTVDGKHVAVIADGFGSRPQLNSSARSPAPAVWLYRVN